MHRGAEASPAHDVGRRLRIQHNPIVSEVELKPVLKLCSHDRPDAQGLLERADREREQETAVCQTQNRRVHLAERPQGANRGQRLRQIGGHIQDHPVVLIHVPLDLRDVVPERLRRESVVDSLDQVQFAGAGLPPDALSVEIVGIALVQAPDVGPVFIGPGFSLIEAAPDEGVLTTPISQSHQQRAVRHLMDVARGHGLVAGFHAFQVHYQRGPGPSAVFASVHATTRVVHRIANVASVHMRGNE